MKHIAFKFFCILFIGANSAFSQSKTLESKGSFQFLELKKELSQSDADKIGSYNFDEYRFYNLKKKIQLVNGPLIELLSIKEIEAKGIIIPSETLNMAKSKSETFKHETILLLNIGLGVYPAYEPK